MARFSRNFRYRGNFREAVDYAKTIICTEIETWGNSRVSVLVNTLAGPVSQMGRQDEFIESLIRDSRHSTACWDALLSIGERMCAEGPELPDYLAHWAAEAHFGLRERPINSDPGSTDGRDFALIGAIRALTFGGVTKTRVNEPRQCCEEGNSAIDAAGAAWNELVQDKIMEGKLLGYSAVRSACYRLSLQPAVRETWERLFKTRLPKK